MDEKKEIKGNRPKKRTEKNTPCETCTYYDVIGDDGALGCTVDVDEDDLYGMRTGKSGCPYYKYYNEYKSVQKQN